MARMSDFHVVGDPRFAPDAPSGGGVSKEYVDNADIEVKKTAANGHNDKFDETVIPSQFTNKLYVYGNPESMYHATDIGGEIPAIMGGHCSVNYNWWGTQVDAWLQNDYKIYDNIYNRLFIAKCIDQSDSRCAQYIIACFDKDARINANPDYNDHPERSIYNSGNISKKLAQDYSGDPPTPQGYYEDTDISTYSGGKIADFNFENNQYYGFSVTGIPMFVVNSNNQSEFDKINYYIQTGDYINAVNYSELYPDNPTTYVAIDVITGDWYKVVNNAWVKQGTLELNSSGGGASNLSDLSDVELTNLSDGQILKYNSTSEKWENADNQGLLPFDIIIDPNDNGINLIYSELINGITKVYDSTDSGVSSYTIEESGIYMVINTYSANSTHEITIPQTARIINSGNLGSDRGVSWIIAELQDDDEITINTIPSNWVAFSKTVYRIDGINIKSLVDTSYQSDGTATYTPPQDNSNYLMVGVSMGRTTGLYRNDTDTSSSSCDIMIEQDIGVNTTIGIYYGIGSQLPQANFYGYDGGCSCIFNYLTGGD